VNASIDTQRAIGAVLGSAVGDALGAPFEFGPPGQYSARFPEPVLGGIGEMVGGGGFGWAPGEFTDDTQMAIVQAESILAHEGVAGADLFERFRVWASQAADVGVQTSAVLRSGLPWDEAAADYVARNPRSGGNGSLMRSTPTAVRYASASTEDTMAVARSCSAITHGDPAAGWGTGLLHVMVRAELRGGDAFAALAEQLDRLQPDQDRYRRMLAADWTPDHMEVPNGSVWGCLAQAVWAVRTTTSFADAVIAAIELGGDTDTVAAVTGGLAGARYGVQAIPSRWTTYVHGHVTTPEGRRTYDSVTLQELAARLLGKRPPAMAPLGPGVGPTEMAPGVFAADLVAAATTPPDTAVISLCRTGGRLDDHPIRRSVYLVDQLDANPSLDLVLEDVLATIDAFRLDGRDVVVHCHHGESRTGFVLRAWLMHHHGWDEPAATQYLADRWPHLRLHNDTFTDALRRRSP
jgi:ADP-ribosyl-[dinitrogen reductase] hydrolase